MIERRLLVTRFAPHAQLLADQLNEQGVFALAQPLLEIKEVPSCYSPFGKQYDYIIAISAHAVKYTDLHCSGNWPISQYIAVGKATQSLLVEKVDQLVSIPEDDFSTEGLLALSALNDLAGKSVLILRGVGGRELLKQALLLRGATVDYYESYQRVAINLPRSISVQKWQQQAINGAIISSVELLERLIVLASDKDEKWLKSLTLFAPSERILNLAITLEFKNIALLPSISNQQIINYFTDGGSYDRD